MKVDRVFSHNVVRIQAWARLEQAAKLMRERHVGALLVTGDGPEERPVGVVTDRDLVGAIAAELGSLNRILGSELRHEMAREGESGELTA